MENIHFEPVIPEKAPETVEELRAALKRLNARQNAILDNWENIPTKEVELFLAEARILRQRWERDLRRLVKKEKML